MKIRFTALALLLACGTAPLAAQETIVALRHGEKPAAGLGQLNCEGLQRALALPRLLVARYGRPAAIFAPNPTTLVQDGKQSKALVPYVRPFVTIEPTAIALGMPVNLQFAYSEVDKLQAAVTAPEYAHAVVFVAWEHGGLVRFARQMLKTFGLDPAQVPDWPESDYGRIYVFRIGDNHGHRSLDFKIEREGLSGKLTAACPE